MSSEYQKTTLGALLSFSNGRPSPNQIEKGAYCVFGSNGAIGRCNAWNAPSRTIIIGRVGSYCGSVHFSADPCWVTDNAIRASAQGDNDAWFLYCLLQDLDLNNWRSGSGQPLLTQTILSAIEVDAPAPHVQRRIGELAADFNIRIALLREASTTLEAIAQALFKSWFVDFDPVHAKMGGRVPESMDEGTMALFPSSFGDTGVPDGWYPGVLGEVACAARRHVKVENLHGGIRYVGLEHVPRQSLSLEQWGHAEGLESSKIAFSKGDILFGKLRPYFHKVVIAPFDGVCSSDILVCQANDTAYYGFATMHLSSLALIQYADRLSNGAKMPRVSWQDLAQFPLVVPSKKVAALYTATVQPLFDQIVANTSHAETLRSVRDTLLPRLISGRLRLPEAAQEIADATRP